MKLYFAPGACSMAPHITLHESGLPFTAEAVSMQDWKTKSGKDFKKINPKGYVPALELDNGELLTEGAVIMQYIADKAPAAKLIPAAGTMERYRAQEWLNYISTELHKGFSPLFSPDTPEAFKAAAMDRLGQRLDFANRAMEGKQYLLGDQFTIADAYLFTVLSWAPYVKFDLTPFSALTKFQERVRAREKVKATLEAEHASK